MASGDRKLGHDRDRVQMPIEVAVVHNAREDDIPEVADHRENIHNEEGAKEAVHYHCRSCILVCAPKTTLLFHHQTN